MSRQLRIGVIAALAIAISLAALLFARSPNPPGAAIASTSPGDGAWLARAPDAVELSSTAPLVLSQSHVTVWGSSGVALNSGQPTLIIPDKLRQPVSVTGAGDVTVTYHVTFVDGAQLAGTLRFTVGAAGKAGPRTPTASAAASSHTNNLASGSTHEHRIDPISAAILVLDGIVVLAVLVLLMYRPRPR